MTEAVIIDIFTQTLVLIIKVSAPMLLVSLVVGLIVSILQTITSIQEQTLTFVPKLLAIFLTLMLAGNWILTTLREFIIELFQFQSYLN
ncbi:MAG: flagellar biosynthesis protein FliQ [Lachnospiraceae bacterium]|nr:flagellar biosynthesis protein FliQ [Lachnospiraceae bacterium]